MDNDEGELLTKGFLTAICWRATKEILHVLYTHVASLKHVRNVKYRASKYSDYNTNFKISPIRYIRPEKLYEAWVWMSWWDDVSCHTHHQQTTVSRNSKSIIIDALFLHLPVQALFTSKKDCIKKKSNLFKKTNYSIE